MSLWCVWDIQSQFYNPPQLLNEWPVRFNFSFQCVHHCLSSVLRDNPAWSLQMLQKHYQYLSSWMVFILSSLTLFLDFLYRGLFRDFLCGFYMSNRLNVLLCGWWPSTDYKLCLYVCTIWWTVKSMVCPASPTSSLRIKEETTKDRWTFYLY